MRYTMVRPCAHCPFRNDRPGYLGRGGARAILRAILHQDATFACHETTVAADDESGEMDVTAHSQHCAGALIFLERQGRHGRPNQMMRIAERLGIYDRRKLDMTAPVVQTAREFLDLHHY